MPRQLRDKLLGPERIVADGVEFIGCTFAGTILVYRGGAPFMLGEGTGGTLELVFEGPARNTMEMLAALHRFLPDVAEGFLARIRNPFGDSIN